MQKEMIENLEQTIEKEAQALAAKKAVLKEMKKEHKQKFFGQGKLGRAYLHTVRFLTSPFAKAAISSSERLNDPVSCAGADLYEDAADFIKKYSDITTPQCRGAKSVCNKAATYVMSVEEFLAKYGEEANPNLTAALAALVEDLRQKVAETRPPKNEEDKKKEEQIKELVAQEVEKIVATMTIPQEAITNDRNSNESSSIDDSGSVPDLRQTPEESEEVHCEAQPVDGHPELHRSVHDSGRDADSPVRSSDDGCDDQRHAACS